MFPQASINTPAPAGRPPALTPRQLDLIDAIKRGLSNREIAAELRISEQTVKNHLTEIYDKLNVRGRLQLAVCALSNDIR